VTLSSEVSTDSDKLRVRDSDGGISTIFQPTIEKLSFSA
jgi:hypothetical protein